MSTDVDRIKQFLHQYLQASGMELEFSVQTAPAMPAEAQDHTVEVRFHGQDVPLLLDRRAELLNALEHLAAKLLGLAPEEHHRVRFDAAGYKSNRDQELQALAQQAIAEVTASGHPFRLSPMNSRERRLIHLLIAPTGLRSVSSGEGTFRSITVHPPDSVTSAKPAASTPETDARLARLRKSFGRR